jgi:hypothetical protein
MVNQRPVSVDRLFRFVGTRHSVGLHGAGVYETRPVCSLRCWSTQVRGT